MGTEVVCLTRGAMAENEPQISRNLRTFSHRAGVDNLGALVEPVTRMSKPSLKHPVGWVRLVGLTEGVSYLALLGVAMPLKYLADMPMAVKVVGSIHGGLFVLLALVTAVAWIIGLLGSKKGLSFKHSAMVMGASLLPFGPFLIDRRLAKDEADS